MLEWYKCGISAEENISITEDLIRELATEKTPEELKKPFREMSMEEAFQELAGFSLEKNLSSEALAEKNREYQIPVNDKDNWEVLFHKLFLTLVEPELPSDCPLVLTRYPSRLKTLAADIPGTPWSDRWELYIRGVEIANCYTEETDADKVRDFYRMETEAKEQNSSVSILTDPEYPELFSSFPACSGTAVGVDRLMAQILGIREIEGVILFPLSDIVS